MMAKKRGSVALGEGLSPNTSTVGFAAQNINSSNQNNLH